MIGGKAMLTSVQMQIQMQISTIKVKAESVGGWVGR